MDDLRELICIGCPKGCKLETRLENGKVIEVKGYSCEKGKNYAEKECTNPTRILTSTLKVEGGRLRVVSVKTEKDIPKDKIMECVESLRGVVVKAPINLGDIIIENIADTGVNIIATKGVSKSKS